MYSGWDPPRGGGCPIRISTDQRLLAAPRGFSQRATSFIASWCQGIHQMPLSRSYSATMHRIHPRLQNAEAPIQAAILLSTGYTLNATDHCHTGPAGGTTRTGQQPTGQTRHRSSTTDHPRHTPPRGSHPSDPAQPAAYQNQIHNRKTNNAPPVARPGIAKCCHRITTPTGMRCSKQHQALEHGNHAAPSM